MSAICAIGEKKSEKELQKMNEGKNKMCEVWEVASRAEAAQTSISMLNFIAGELHKRVGDEPEKGGCE